MARDHMMGFAPAAVPAADVDELGESYFANDSFFDDAYPLGYPTRLKKQYEDRLVKRHAQIAKFARFELGNHAPDIAVLQRHCDEENKRAAKARELLKEQQRKTIAEALANSSPVAPDDASTPYREQAQALDAFRQAYPQTREATRGLILSAKAAEYPEPPAEPAPKRWDLLHANPTLQKLALAGLEQRREQVAALLKAPADCAAIANAFYENLTGSTFAVEAEAQGFKVVPCEQAHAAEGHPYEIGN